MAIILLEHYFKNKRINIEILIKSYKKWAFNNGIKDGIGLHTEAILLRNKTDKDSQGKFHFYHEEFQVQTNHP